jgi:multicomponent Na+:H+ antiporter subunit D
MEKFLPLFIAIPLGLGFLSVLSGKIYKRLPEIFAVLATAALLIMSLSLIGYKPFHYAMGNWNPPIGISLVVDNLSILLLLIISIISFLVVLYSIKYLDKYTGKAKFFALLMLMITGMNGVVLSGDFFNLFVFLEIASISSYALVGFGGEKEELEASFKYLVLGTVSSSMILLAVGILYASAGSLNMADVALFIQTDGLNKAVLFSCALFLMGFGLKAAMVPFHAWLPDAHPSAPAPISAMLSGVLIKALGVYAIARIFYNVIGMAPIFKFTLMGMGLLSMVVGALLAIGQWDIKRLMGYSSISQMGYVVLGLSIGTSLGIIGALFHLINHAAFKSLLFLSSGSIEYSTGTRNMKDLGGLIKKMPVTGTACSIGCLSISGVPPFNGFWSKLIIIIALVQADYYTLAIITILVSFLTLIYYVKVQKFTIFGSLPFNLKEIKETPALMYLPLAVLALICIGAGILYPFYGKEILENASRVLLDNIHYISYALGSN